MKRRIAWIAGVFAIVLFFAFGGGTLFGIRTLEAPPYTVVLEDGAIEVREYGAFLVAETSVATDDYDESGSRGFRRLGGYIFGRNRTGDSEESRKIPMTVPVIQERRDEAWTMAFVMPSEHTRETLPEPLDPSVEFRTVPGRTVAALRYTGFVTEAKMRARTERLKVWLTERGYAAASVPRSARYDPPWTIPFLRRNEILIDVTPRAPAIFRSARTLTSE